MGSGAVTGFGRVCHLVAPRTPVRTIALTVGELVHDIGDDLVVGAADKRTAGHELRLRLRGAALRENDGDRTEGGGIGRIVAGDQVGAAVVEIRVAVAHGGAIGVVRGVA